MIEVPVPTEMSLAQVIHHLVARIEKQDERHEFDIARRTSDAEALEYLRQQVFTLEHGADQYKAYVADLEQRVSHLAARLRQYENADWPEDAEETPLDMLGRLQDENEHMKAQLESIWHVFSRDWREEREGRHERS